MHRKYTDTEREFIRAFAYGHSYKEITDEFNKRFHPAISSRQVKSYLGNHAINTGRTGKFVKGHVPANKGTHNGGWKPTQFKKGHMPANHKPVGSETIRSRKDRKETYTWVKVAEPNKWRMKHILVWEEHNGPVPPGKIITFLDSDTLNTDISNLVLIDRKINVRLNKMGLRHQDKEITEAGIALAELVTKISETERKLRKKGN